MIDLTTPTLIARYSTHILRAAPKQSRIARCLIDWLQSDGDSILPEPNRADLNAQTDSDEQRSRIIQLLAPMLQHTARQSLPPVQTNVNRLTSLLKLNETEAAILTMGAALRFNPVMGGFLMAFHRCNTTDALALMLRCKRTDIMMSLQQSAVLKNTGILHEDRLIGASDLDDIIQLSSRIYSWLASQPGKGKSSYAGLLGEAQRSSLSWSDFEHLSEARDFLERMLSGALRTQAKGINILLYGPPGTGKTELCKALAARLRTPLYSIAETDEAGDEATRIERMRALRLANKLLLNAKPALLLFDEMEDLLDAGYGRMVMGGSKVFLNRMLENNPLPTFWTTNAIGHFDPALLRRMTIAIEMKAPPEQNRRRIWQRLAQTQKLSLSTQDIDRLARDFNEAPAIAEHAIKAAQLADGGIEQVRFALANAHKLMEGKSKLPTHDSVAFNPAFAHADTNLDHLTTQLIRPDAGQHFSLCLYGPPGTGKTAYTRYLAQQMGLELKQLRASDLLSKWVGDTEKRIAAAFREAIEENAFLVFDEADSLLQDRQNAQRSWEVTQVNEMLTWMESHPLPFACTTNLMQHLDTASLRRFTFKIGFHYLTAEQAAACFRHYFGKKPPAAIAQLTCLTPADFAVVKRKAIILGLQKDVTELLSMLLKEQRDRHGIKQPLGFRMAS